MSSITIQVFDGFLPMKIVLDPVPEDFNALFAAVAKLYPDRSQSLLDRSFQEGIEQDYAILHNKKRAQSRDEKIAPGDDIVIIGVFSGG